MVILGERRITKKFDYVYLVIKISQKQEGGGGGGLRGNR